MTSDATAHVRLTPEVQAEYQQIYNDPARVRTSAWYVAAKGLFAAGLISIDPSASNDLPEALGVADSQTEQQSL